jgi:hypothetical protein
MIRIFFSFNFYKFRYSAYSGNRNFLCRFFVLHLIFITVYGILWHTQFVSVVKYYCIGDLYTIKLDLFHIWRLYHQIWISGTNKDMNMNILTIFCKSTNYEGPHYASLSSIQLLIQIFFTAPYSQKLSTYVLSIIWKTKLTPAQNINFIYYCHLTRIQTLPYFLKIC